MAKYTSAGSFYSFTPFPVFCSLVYSPGFLWASPAGVKTREKTVGKGEKGNMGNRERETYRKRGWEREREGEKKAKGRVNRERERTERNG